MYRHLEHVHLHEVFEPVLLNVFRRIHIYSYDERTSEFSLKTIDLLVCLTHLEAEIVDVHSVIHAFGAYGDYLERVDGARNKIIHLELGRNIDGFLYLLRRYFCRVVEYIGSVSLHKYLNSMYTVDSFEFRLECHRAAVACHGTESLDGSGLESAFVHKLCH